MTDHDHNDTDLICDACHHGDGPEGTFLRAMDMITRYGWTVTGVFDPDNPENMFAYTTGLSPMHPEVMVRGASVEQMHFMLNDVARKLLAGTIEVGVPNLHVLTGSNGEDMPVLLVPQTDAVDDGDWAMTNQYASVMSQVDAALRDGVVKLSLLWPDENGLLPTDEGVNPVFADRQRPW